MPSGDAVDAPHERDAAGEQAFIDGLLARGEAVPDGTDPLPPGVTHVVVVDPDGHRRAVRRRFSAF